MQIDAEGVETEAQAARLRQCGCDVLQGYLFCEPMPSKDFAAWLSGLVDDGQTPQQPAERTNFAQFTHPVG